MPKQTPCNAPTPGQVAPVGVRKRVGLRLRAWVGGAVGTLALATLASRIFGFGRWLAQSAFVGSGATAGAYASANQIPNIIFEIIIGGALTGVTVPLLAGALRRGDRRQLDSIASALLTWVLLILTTVAMVVFFLAPTVAHALPVPLGADPQTQHALITTFLRIFTWQIPLYGACLVLTGILQAHERFLLPALGPLFASVVVIATFATYAAALRSGQSHTALAILAWGTTAGVAAMTVPLLFPVWKLGVRLRPTLHLEATHRRRAVKLGASGLGALLAQQVSVVVALWLMRRWGEGGTVAVFQYVQAVYWLPYAILAYPLATAAFPKLSQLGEDGAGEDFQRTCAWATRRVVTAALVGSAMISALAPVAQAFFELLTPVPGMGRSLFLIAPAMIGYAMLYHGQRVLYAVMATRSAWQVGVLSWLAVAGFATVATVGFARNGHALYPGASWADFNPQTWTAGEQALAGIAVGHTVGLMVAVVGVLVAIYRQVGPAGLRGLGANTWRLVLTLTPATVAGWGLSHWWVSGEAGVWLRIAQCVAAAVVALLLLAGAVVLSGRSVRADFTAAPR
ncbi:MAG: lipid II flippase MurJ [Actinomycetaceae bacterium]|nr:lipid II flippase MurJ [Actinomycetaceae bacterium]